MRPVLLIIISLFLINFNISDLFADEIYLKSGSVLKGKVLKVTPETIEYDPDDNRTFDIVVKKQALKILYDNGEEVILVQDTSKNTTPGTPDETKQCRKSPNNHIPGKFIEIEWGWNGYVGLGGRFDFMITNSFSMNVGLGLSFWGWRLGAGFRYYFFDSPYGPALGLGFSHTNPADGGKNKSKMEQVDADTGVKSKKELEFEYKPVNVANITFLYSWQVFTSNRIYLEVGYSIRFKEPKENYEVKDPNAPDRQVILTNDSKTILNGSQPGGILLALGFAFSF